MTTKLIVYNEALLVCGERLLTALDSPATEQSQIELDRVWNGGAVNYCLEKGLWQFAERAISLSYDPDTTVQFGYQRAFNKPTDLIRISNVSADERFSVPLLDYNYRADFFFADHDTLYLKYISNDAQYGADLTLWPETFVKYVGVYLAWCICNRLTQSKLDKSMLKDEMDEKLSDAKAKDAIANPTKFPPSGSWANSRGGHGRRDRGSRNRLIG
jgi:hypothetical protein